MNGTTCSLCYLKHQQQQISLSRPQFQLEVNEEIQMEQPPVRGAQPATAEVQSTVPAVEKPTEPVTEKVAELSVKKSAKPSVQFSAAESSPSSSEDFTDSTTFISTSSSTPLITATKVKKPVELPLIALLQPSETTPIKESMLAPVLDLDLNFNPQPIRVVPATSTTMVAQSDSLTA